MWPLALMVVAFFQGQQTRVCVYGTLPAEQKSIALIHWDLETGTKLRSLSRKRTGWINSTAFSPVDSNIALSGSYGDTNAETPDRDRGSVLILWNLQKEEMIHDLKGHIGVVYDVANSPDGFVTLPGSTDTKMILRDLKTGKEIRRFEGHNSHVTSVAFSPDAELLCQVPVIKR